MPGRRPKVVVVTNADSFFVSHRLPLGRALRERGYDVLVAAGESPARATIEAAGLRFAPIAFDRGGTSVTRDAATIRALVALYRRERPDVVHHVTIKPVLYGSLASRVAPVRGVINAVSGLGYAFIDRPRFDLRHAALRRGVEAAYRVALSGARTRTIFQNPDDRDLFVRRGMVRADRTVLIRGSGVDTARFRPTPLPGGPPLVVLPARMLWDKGVREFVDAARALRARGARFALVGAAGESNPAAIDAAQLDAWVREGVVEWWGHRRDMPEVLAQASLVVLPSYREGMPLALAEAAAAGRASITTDVPGCREIVQHGVTGWLVPARDAGALARAMADALSDHAELVRRGERARALAEAQFSLQGVLAQTLAVYEQLLGARGP